ncbi:MAG: HTTM domain-containing protein [Myxococcota bacterium]
MVDWTSKGERLLFSRIDIAWLVAFRVMFGLLVAWDAWRYVWSGTIAEHFVTPPLLLKFAGFEWVTRMGAFGMNAVYVGMVVTGLAIAAGLFYRAACVGFFFLHTYIFLVAAEYYLNHAYLISVLSLLMATLPAHRAASLDVRRRPEIHTREVHQWPWVLLIGVLGVVYTYGAIAKMNPDWLAAEPVRHWLRWRAEAASDAWVRRVLIDERFVFLIAYGGLFFDLLVVPGMLWRRTRPLFVLLSMGFHLTNAFLFNIGVFPWLMIAATTMFFDRDWPRRVPGYRETFSSAIDTWGTEEDAAPTDPLAGAPRARIVYGLSAFFTVMLLLPLRHHLYPGDVAWNEEGHNYSWRMKLRDKQGRFTYRIVDRNNGERWRVDPREQLTPRQYRKACARPMFAIQYAHYLRDAYRTEGREVSIYADHFVSLNYRPARRLFDPEVDLAAVERNLFAPDPWITPFPGDPLPSPAIALRRELSPRVRQLTARVAR